MPELSVGANREVLPEFGKGNGELEMHSNNRELDLLITNATTWGTIFVAFIATCITGIANAKEYEPRPAGAQAKAVASAVISHGVTFGSRQLSQVNSSGMLVEPQRTLTRCDQSYELTNCTLIIKEMQ